MNDGDSSMFESAIDPDSAVGEVVIPETIYDLPVVGIGEKALCDCSDITSVRIPESVAALGQWAFYGCSSMTNVVIPNGVTVIGERAFNNCSKLPDIAIPASVGALGDSSFRDCQSLTNVIFETRSGPLLIGDSAFANCRRLLVFDLPAAVELKSIGTQAFYGCTSLSGDFVIPSTVTNVGQKAFYNCESLMSIRFAEPTNSPCGALTIGKSAFFGCTSVTNLYLAQNVTEMEEAAFQGMSALSSVCLPTNLTAIADSLFVDCASLTRIDLPTNMLRTIGSQAFYYSTNLCEFTISESVESIGSGAFRSTGFWQNWPADSPLVVKDGWLLGVKGACPGDVALTNVEHVADGALANAQTLTNLFVPATVQTIGAHAFSGCTNFSTVVIEDGVAIDDTAFDGSNWCPFAPGGGVAFDPSAAVTNFHVAFNPAGGEGNMATQTFRYGVANQLASNSFTRAGYEFAGWGLSSAGAVDYADGQMVSNLTAVADGVVELFARWRGHTYTVAFHANGGAGNMATQAIPVNVGVALSSNRFARAGYLFVGWAESGTATNSTYADGQVVTNLTHVPFGNVDLYAFWEPVRYTLSFDANQGTGQMESMPFVYDTPQALPSNRFTRVGYYFDGWLTSTTGVHAAYADRQVVSNLTAAADGVVTLYANWTMLTTQMVDGVLWHFTSRNGAATIERRSGSNYVAAVDAPLTNLVVPSSLGGVPVVGIGVNAFRGLTSLTNVVIPATVASIAAGAFAGCANIQSATMPVPSPLYEIMPNSYRRIRRVVVPSGTSDFLEDEIELCECAFSNCTALVSADLPLGVKELPRSLFEDCVSFTGFGTQGDDDMPYTVETIGERAFAGCTGLTALTVTEKVKGLGANAFTGCSRLKVVRYLGDEPADAAEGGTGGIYYRANSALVSGYLKGLRNWPSVSSAQEEQREEAQDEIEDDPDGSTPSATVSTVSSNRDVTVIWPAGGNGRKLLPWNTKMYQFKKVTFDYNRSGSSEVVSRIYPVGRVLGSLPGDEDEDDASDDDAETSDATASSSHEGFLGWFTARYGGVEVDPYTVVNSAMTFYAHWEGASSEDEARGLVEVFESFYGDADAGFAFSAAVFDGILLSDGKVAGTISVKTQKGQYSSSAEGSNSVFAATMQVLGSKKASLRGLVASDGTASAENEKTGLSLELAFTQFGFSGTYSTEDGDYEIVGARDRYSASSSQAKTLVWTALANARGVWSVVLPVESADGDGAALAQGYAGLSVTIGSKGKSRVIGTMPDGTRVAVSSTLILGDGCACLPVVVPLYAGKSGGLAFALWFTWSEDGSESQVSVAGCSDWDATRNKAAPFVATFGEPIVGPVASGALTGTKTFGMDDFFEGIGAEDSFSPNGTEIEMSGARWQTARADGVRFSKDDGWYVADDKDYGNPAGLKLTFAAKTGAFKGSFKVFAETEEGKSKKYTATVVGVVVDGVGYGTATVKKVGSVPVKVE